MHCLDCGNFFKAYTDDFYDMVCEKCGSDNIDFADVCGICRQPYYSDNSMYICDSCFDKYADINNFLEFLKHDDIDEFKRFLCTVIDNEYGLYSLFLDMSKNKQYSYISNYNYMGYKDDYEYFLKQKYADGVKKELLNRKNKYHSNINKYYEDFTDSGTATDMPRFSIGDLISIKDFPQNAKPNKLDVTYEVQYLDDDNIYCKKVKSNSDKLYKIQKTEVTAVYRDNEFVWYIWNTDSENGDIEDLDY